MSSDRPLTPAQIDDLCVIAGIMIPASMEFDVPGADDPTIQADILATAATQTSYARLLTRSPVWPNNRWPV